MNERIRELEAQCWESRKYGPPWFDSEKFAELIVKECASMARAYGSHKYDFTGDLELDEFMLKHFGVE